MTPAAARVVLIGGACSLALAGCGDGPTHPEGDCGQIYGSFAGRASGASSDSLNGCGYYAFNSLDGFGMVLSNGGPYGEPMVKVMASLVLTGTRTVPEHFSGAVIIGTRTLTLTSGMLTATMQAGNWERKQLVGTLDVTGTDEISGETVRVTGAFQSGCVGKHESPSQGGDRARTPPAECAVQGAGSRAP